MIYYMLLENLTTSLRSKYNVGRVTVSAYDVFLIILAARTCEWRYNCNVGYRNSCRYFFEINQSTWNLQQFACS